MFSHTCSSAFWQAHLPPPSQPPHAWGWLAQESIRIRDSGLLTPAILASDESRSCEYNSADSDPHYPSDSSLSQPSLKKRRSSSSRQDTLSYPNGTPVLSQDKNAPEVKGSYDASYGINPFQPNHKQMPIMDVGKTIGHFRDASTEAMSQAPEIKLPTANSPSRYDDEEEVDNYTLSRMLDDGTGRLIYIGDSATISFLQLIRMMVETTAGPCPFTQDPARHEMIEAPFSVPPNKNSTRLLPNKETTVILVEAFFIQTHGVMEVFDEQSFLQELDESFSDPLSIDHTWLCNLNLVLAIGFSLASPAAGSKEEGVIESFRKKYPDHSENFYHAARDISNLLSGFEEPNFWSIRALTLMTFYLLMRSRQNTACAYHGMAVRSAYALGIHREETLSVFSPPEQRARRGVWRSLYILDGFLAVSLGRPVAIAREGSPEWSFGSPDHATSTGLNEPNRHLCSAGIEASVRSGHVMGSILCTIYQQRKISVKQAQALADECGKWPENLSPELHWRQASSDNVRQAVAILHANIAYCHSILLLTRPFFLNLLSQEIQRTRLNSTIPAPRPESRVMQFSNACAIASTHTIALIYQAYQGGYLSRLNAFATYSTFAAAIILFANEYARPTTNSVVRQCMLNAIIILQYCGKSDVQARLWTTVLENFLVVINAQGNPKLLGPSRNVGPQFPLQTSARPSNTGRPESFVPGTKTSVLPFLPPTDGSVPLKNAFTSEAEGHFETLAPSVLNNQDSFSGLLDLQNTVLPTDKDRRSSSFSDEDFNFDTLWEWPSGSPL
ncbi:MAG: hypothetical protein OHK93_006023 [Ramalina farinacea]|uniref:Xylanolytic transcriptional activator regulatory domain-containing protein n=1 Tax=Ramalina farinacea TaxID=258253 RepID=A0AA43QHR9_9LECA|nr:hypothetical protein [Ramalina farinacea]